MSGTLRSTQPARLQMTRSAGLLWVGLQSDAASNVGLEFRWAKRSVPGKRSNYPSSSRRATREATRQNSS
jgi:hypothetical protein